MNTLKRIQLAALLLLLTLNAAAQEFEGGIIKYQQTTRYDFAKIFNIDVNEGGQMAEWIAGLPTEVRKIDRLIFNEEAGLFQEDPDAQKAIPANLQSALSHVKYVSPPQAVVTQTYYYLDKKEWTRQIEFMTRHFILTEPAVTPAWKLLQKPIKIQNYTCTAAEMKQGDDVVTAYFTAEIPVPFGPAEFHGLPGLILAVEINGETAYMATSVQMKKPEDGLLTKPQDGKAMTAEAFKALVADKEKEWRETQSRQQGTARGHQ